MNKKRIIVTVSIVIVSMLLLSLTYKVFLQDFSFHKINLFKSYSTQEDDFKIIRTIDKYGNENESTCYREIEIVGDGKEVEVWKKVIEPESKNLIEKTKDGLDIELEYNKEIRINDDGTEQEVWLLAQDPIMETIIYEGIIKKVVNQRLYFMVEAESILLDFENMSYEPFEVGPYEKIIDLDEYKLTIESDDIFDHILIEGIEVKDISLVEKKLEDENLIGSYIYIQKSKITFFKDGPLSKILSIRDFEFKDAKK